MIIKLLIEGGDMKPGPAIAQKLGPMGINIGKVIQDINASTKEFKGTKVPVELDVDGKSKSYKINVSSPPVAELIKKELGIEKGAGEAKKLKAGNLAFEQIVKIAKTKHSGMLAREFKSAVKSVVGSCVSLGVLIENKEAKEIENDIEAGKYNKEIKEQLSEASPEKIKQLKEYFNGLRKKQEEIIKKEEEAKAAEEAAKAAEAAAKPQVAPTAGAAATTPAAEAGKKPAEVKPAAKK